MALNAKATSDSYIEEKETLSGHYEDQDIALGKNIEILNLRQSLVASYMYFKMAGATSDSYIEETESLTGHYEDQDIALSKNIAKFLNVG